MSQLTGTEFQNEKGTQGNLLKWIWGKIYPFINAVLPDVAAAISTALEGYATEQYVDDAIAQEVIDPDAAISTLQGTLQTAINAKTTTAEVAMQIETAIAALVDGAPTALDTLKKLADALAANESGDDSTLNALNALITTVDGKASQADLTALEGRVTTVESDVAALESSKADVTYVDGAFTTKTKTNELKALVANALTTAIASIAQFMYLTKKKNIGTNNSLVRFVSADGFLEDDAVLAIHNTTVGLSLKVFELFTSTFPANWGAIDLSSLFVDKNNYDVIVLKKNGEGEELDAYANTQMQLCFNPAVFTSGSEVNDFEVLYTVNVGALIYEDIENNTSGVSGVGSPLYSYTA